MKSKPDMIVILAAAFGLGVLATLLMPMASESSVAAPASPLQAGIITER